MSSRSKRRKSKRKSTTMKRIRSKRKKHD